MSYFRYSAYEWMFFLLWWVLSKHSCLLQGPYAYMCVGVSGSVGHVCAACVPARADCWWRGACASRQCSVVAVGRRRVTGDRRRGGCHIRSVHIVVYRRGIARPRDVASRRAPAPRPRPAPRLSPSPRAPRLPPDSYALAVSISSLSFQTVLLHYTDADALDGNDRRWPLVTHDTPVPRHACAVTSLVGTMRHHL